MTPNEALSELWRYETVHCVVVPLGQHLQLELRNADGAAFLRKVVPTRQTALNDAEYLRLLVTAHERLLPQRGLKPFALVIEDDHRGTGFPVTQALRASGMRAFGCRSGVEGVALARELMPDLIVLDYRLSDVSGADVCRMVRADPLTAPIPIVAVTASPEGLRERACGVDAVLIRPCQIDTLLAAARLFVGHMAAPDAAQ